MVETRFYTAIAEVDPLRSGDSRRRQKQIHYCERLGDKHKWYVFSKHVKTYVGQYPYCHRDLVCDNCKNTVKSPKNKGVDVAIATDLAVYGLSPTGYDAAILVSGDSDFAPVIRKIRDRNPRVRIEIAQFSFAVNRELKRATHSVYELENYANQIRE